MGLIKSLKKSWKLSRLQKVAYPQGQSMHDFTEEFFSSLDGESKRDKALDAFWNLCAGDDDVQRVMLNYHIRLRDLNELHGELLGMGLGWVRGHFVPLSTLAYFEPFLYFVESRKQCVESVDIASKLLAYWEGRIAQGQLVRMLKS